MIVKPVIAGVSADCVAATQLSPGGGFKPEQFGRLPSTSITMLQAAGELTGDPRLPSLLALALDPPD